ATMPDAAVAADVHEALDVHRDLAPQVALDLQLALDDVANARGLLVAPRLHALGRIHAGLGQDARGRRPADAVDVRDRHLTTLLAWKIDSRHSRHTRLLTLPLLVPRILADDAGDALPLDDLAVLAPRLDRRSDFHGSPT